MKEELEEYIEAFVDGELPDSISVAVQDRIDSDPAFAKQVLLARSIKTSLSLSENWTAPKSIEKAVLQEIKSQRRSQKLEASGKWWSGSWPIRTALQVACLVAIAVFMGYWISPDTGDTPNTEFTSIEIQQAEEDIKWVMAFVSDTGLQTGHKVRDDVIAKRVVTPMQTQVKTSIIN